MNFRLKVVALKRERVREGGRVRERERRKEEVGGGGEISLNVCTADQETIKKFLSIKIQNSKASE